MNKSRDDECKRAEQLPSTIPRISLNNTSNNKKKVAIGIDLGTTYSCVYYYDTDTNQPHVILNDIGKPTTPSIVAFIDKNIRLVGDTAKLQANDNSRNTIFDVKRLIGREYNDIEVQKDILTWPFTVISDNDGKPVISVMDHNNNNVQYSAESISAMILSKLKLMTEKYLDCIVSDAVITVPAYFNDSQRNATKDAGRIAGLNVLRVINEPTAAALAYGLQLTRSGMILVFDLGGGTFDVTLLKIIKDSNNDITYEVCATHGNTHLGGEDFDQHIMLHIKSKFELQHSVSISNDQRAIRRLRTACEAAKRALSAATSAEIQIDSFYHNIDLRYTLTRDEFELLCAADFEACKIPVQNVLRSAKITKDQIDEIVLVGGSTRIPAIQQYLVKEFDRIPCSDINPDEAVAYGAAVQAAILCGQRDKDLLLVDVTPLSLGIETTGGLFDTVIPRNTTVPCEKTKYFTTTVDSQDYLNIKVYEGERARTCDNHYLGEFIHELNDVNGKAYETKISVSFSIDADGILGVESVESNGQKTSIRINNSQNRLSSSEIRSMYIDAENYRLSDKIQADKISSQLNCIAYIKAIESYLHDKKYELDHVKQLVSNVDDAIQSARTQLNQHDELQTASYYIQIQSVLESVCYELFQSCNIDDEQIKLMLQTQHAAQIYETHQSIAEQSGIRIVANDIVTPV